MPLIINNETVTIREIESYQGKDEVWLKLKKSIKELKARFFDKEKQVVYKFHPRYIFRNSLGVLEGKKAILIQYTEYVPSKTGGANVTYCENIITETGGGKKYMPAAGWFKKLETFDATQIEKALYFYSVCRVTSGPSSTVILYDEDQREMDIAIGRKKTGTVDFYIYSDDSPLNGDREKLVGVAYTWGIPDAENMLDDKIRNILHTKVKTAEQKGDADLAIDAFVDAVKRDSPFMKAMVAIQRAIDHGTLIYKNFVWHIVANGSLTAFHQINPAEDGKHKVVLSYYLLSNPEKLRLVEGMAPEMKIEAPDQEGSGEDGWKYYTPEELEALSWQAFKDLAAKLEINTHAQKREEIHEKILAKQALRMADV